MYTQLLGEVEVLLYWCSQNGIKCLLLHFGIHLCVDSNSGKAHHILKVEEIFAKKDVFQQNDPILLGHLGRI